MTLFYRLARRVTLILRCLLFRVSYEGLENIPEQGGYLVVCNHRSFLDPVFLAHGFRRQIYFMAKAELFRRRWAAALMKALGVFAVERGAGDTGVIDHAVDLVKQGKLLGIFPEGTRSRDGKPLRPKSGAALVAKLSGAGIIPCAILFDGRMQLWKRVRIRVGKPVPFEELGFTDESPASLRHAAKQIMSHIVELMEAGEMAGEN